MFKVLLMDQSFQEIEARIGRSESILQFPLRDGQGSSAFVDAGQVRAKISSVFPIYELQITGERGFQIGLGGMKVL